MLLTIDAVGTHDLADLMPMMRDYCDFYRVDPSDERLLALVKALIDNPADGVQLIARGDGTPLGFATIFWTWQTLYAARVGVLNALYVVAASRGAPDNTTAQRLYDGIGAVKSSWLSYELDA